MSLFDEQALRQLIRDEVRAAVGELRQVLAPAPVAAQLLTVADVSRSCQTREKTVLSWISTGRLAARKAGRKWVVLPVDLERFLAGETAANDESDNAAVVRILSRRRA